MKYTILIALLLCSLTVLYAYNGSYPRSDQSCLDQDVLGQFWDGQKCEKCANKHCYCSEYLACDKCQEGYSKYKLDDIEGMDKKNITKCYKCPDNVKDCCFHGESEQFKILENRKNVGGDDDIANQYLIRRALSCSTGLKNQEGKPVGEQRRYGSYCHYEYGCLSYNNYGQCYSCAKGFYQSGTTYSIDVVKTCAACMSNCAECTAFGQCDVCQDGYYLKTNEGRVSHDEDIPASQCAKCNENCLCSGKIGENDEPAKCDLGCINPKIFFQDKTDPKNVKCSIKCPDECTECKLNSEGQPECTECEYKMKVNNDFHADKAKDGKCFKCPSHCHECTLNSEGEVTCKPDHCNNGYYESKSNGIITCKKCSKANNGVQHIMRCNGKEKKDITQCAGDSSITKQSIINIGDIYEEYCLIHAGDNKRANCVQNINNCKIMDEESESKALCRECHEGYFLTKDKKCDICQNSITGCLECESQQDKNICVQCSSGQDIIDYSDLSSQKTLIYNYVISSTSTICQKCATGCKACKEQDKCDEGQCQSGYYYEVDVKQNPCQRCGIEYCKECSNDESCITCWDGYTLSYNEQAQQEKDKYKCVECPKNCTDCGEEKASAEQGRKVCTACKVGSYLKNGACHEPRENCMSYKQDSGECIFCEYKYRVIDGYCFPAVSEGQAYINIEYACGSDHRIMEDGDLLNRSQFEDYLIPISSQILSASALLFALLLTVF